MSVLRSKGYKPNVTAELLEVGDQTLRYWRTHLDPSPHRRCFSADVVLAYQIIKFLTRVRHVPVGVLEKCGCESVFKLCESNELADLSRLAIVIDEKHCDLKVVDSAFQPDNFDLYLHKLALKPVVNEHLDALSGFGHARH